MANSQATAPPLSTRVSDLPESTIRTMFSMAQDYDGSLLRLEICEPDFGTPAHIVDAASTAARNGSTHYTHNAGLMELREAIAAETKCTNNVQVDPESEVLVTAGAVEAIYTALLTIVNPGGEVVLPTPVWPSYLTQAHALNFRINQVPLDSESNFDLSTRMIVDAVTDETDAIILTSPSNPAGQVYDPETVQEVSTSLPPIMPT